MRYTILILLAALSLPVSARRKKKVKMEEAPPVIEQVVEPVVVVVERPPITLKDTISDSSIIIPESMDLATDSVLSDWFVQNYIYTDSSCVGDHYNIDYPDSVYKERLASLPVVMDMTYNPIVKSYINTYAAKRRGLVEYMLGLGNYYFPIFEEVLDKNDMPLELKYLPVIESALKPTARSRMGATGIWQFMHATGRQMGLEINSLVDERCDPVKSSEAAAKYLKQLYNIYNDWSLAIAAYNCGPGNVNKAIKRSGGKTGYWDIYFFLPKETRGYVPAFIAATYIMNYYNEHNLCPVVTDMPAHSDTVVVNKMIHFEQICDNLDISIEQLRMLNPQYRRDIVPGNVEASALRLPIGSLYAFIEQEDTIAKHRKNELLVNIQREVSPGGMKNLSGTNMHRVRQGETLGAIARKYGTTVNALRNINGLRNDNLRIGQQLMVYNNSGVKNNQSNAKTASAKTVSATAKTVSSSAGTGDCKIHPVKSGENLWAISRLYPGVSADDIKRLNGLSGNNLTVGQKLKIPN